MRFYHGKQWHMQNWFLLRISYVIVCVTWQEKQVAKLCFYVCHALWTIVHSLKTVNLLQLGVWTSVFLFPYKPPPFPNKPPPRPPPHQFGPCRSVSVRFGPLGDNELRCPKSYDRKATIAFSGPPNAVIARRRTEGNSKCCHQLGKRPRLLI